MKPLFVASFLLALVPSRALAQTPAVIAARSALAHYDDSSIAAIHALGPVAASTAADAAEARYLRAIAASDLHALALATHDAALDAHVADAMGVGVDSLAATLRSELGAVSVGVFRAAAIDEVRLLDAADAYARGDRPTTGARESALSALAIAGVLGDPDRLASFGTLEPETIGWDERTRRDVSAMHAAHAAFERSARGARDGDPWLVALAPTLDRAHDALRATTLSPPPRVPESLHGRLAEGSSIGDARPDVVLVLEADRFAILCTAHVRVPDAVSIEVIAPARACPALGTVREVSLPPAPAVVRSIEPFVTALSELGVNEGARISLATTREAPAQWVACAHASLARAGLSADTLALERDDGTFGTMPFSWAPLDETSFAMVIHVRDGGYAITRGHEHTLQLPRSHGAFDRDALASTVGERAHGRVALDATSTVSALELVRAANVVAASGATALLRE